MGYVIRKDGKYLRQRKYTTHTGPHIINEWVSYLHQATLFYRQVKLEEGEIALEAIEVRIVTLVQRERMTERVSD